MAIGISTPSGSGGYTGGPSTSISMSPRTRIGGNLQTTPTAVANGPIATNGSAIFTSPYGVDTYISQLSVFNRNVGASIINVYIAPVPTSPAPNNAYPVSYVTYLVASKSVPAASNSSIVNFDQGIGPLFIPAGWSLHVTSTNGVDTSVNLVLEREH